MDGLFETLHKERNGEIMGKHLGNAVLGIIGGYFGVLIAIGFYEIAWGGGFLGDWIFRKSFLWMSDYFIVVPIIGGIFGGSISDSWWGSAGAGFFFALAGYFIFVFMLGGGF